MKFISLNKKFNSIILLILVISFIILFIFLAHETYNSVLENEEKLSLEIGSKFAEEIEFIFKMTIQSINEVEIELNKDSTSRENIIERIKDSLKTNDYLTGMYICYEPNAFDNNDKEYENFLYHDSTGRFIPYVTRNEEVFEVNPLIDYDVEKASWHFITKKTNNVTIINSYYNNENEEKNLMLKFSFPIKDSLGNFIGIIGADVDIRKIQNKAKKMDIQYTYEAIITQNGDFLLHSHNPEFILKNISELPNYNEEIAENISKDKSFTITNKCEVLDKKVLKTFIPIKFDETDTKWFFILTKSYDVILEKYYDLIKIIISIMLLIFLISITIFVFSSKKTTKSLKLLIKNIEGVSEGNYELNVPILGNNEISEINNKFNYMCKKFSIAKKESDLLNEEIKLSEYNFRTLFENSSDAIFILNDSKIIDCNNSASILFGDGTKESVVEKKIVDISPVNQPDGSLSELKSIEIINLSKKNSSHKFEWVHKKQDNTLFTAEIVLTPILLKDNEVIHALVRDISERKELEKELEYLSYHDQLTGVYNRRFFEEKIRELDIKENYPLAVMMGDVNGLKLINDSFGHNTGDELLKKVSLIIQNNCKENDIVSRVGGDEFIVISTNADEYEIEMLESSIRKAAKKATIKSLSISISFGWELKFSDKEDIDLVIKKAEDYLYKKKMFESPSIRNKNIQTIIQTLYEKNKREEKHSRRVSELCAKIAEYLDMGNTRIEELKSVGLLHDIGKIAINEHILNKEGKLTNEEWFEIKKHPEIGYRILSTVNEMAEMAEAVLAHHERWDGKGYPKGLKGNEIPLMARIISIADSFDAMVGERPYKESICEKEALEEIINCSGTQFDPDLVIMFSEIMKDNI